MMKIKMNSTQYHRKIFKGPDQETPIQTAKIEIIWPQWLSYLPQPRPAGPWATSPQSSETPSEVNEMNMDPCFGAAFTEWSEWSDCDPIYNCDSEMNPNNPKKCPKKTRSRQIAWLPNHTPNPECNEPLTEHDESQCNCDKCIFRYGDWVRAPECHGGGHKCHLKFTRFCQLQNRDFLFIDQYKGTGFPI